MKTLATLALVTLLAPATLQADHHGDHAAPKADIVATAIGAGEFTTLVAAVQAAGLVEALQGEGPFTVFAPTDAAFAKLPAGTLQTLLKPENKAMLASILTFHVVPGKIPAEKVAGVTGATTLNGQRVDVSVTEGTVRIDGADVVKADIHCSNGIIHVIDRVILPATDDIVVTAKKAGTFNTLLAAATAAGIAPVLSGEGPFTVFAPTDDAFAKLPAGTVESLLKPENKDQLVQILKYHVVSGRVFSPDAIAAKKAPTLAKQEIRIMAKGGQVMINDAKVVAADIDAKNGVIHVVDSVLLPR
ncbi:MAG: fasciclin domain-containing protein [Planctomycetota bacterium]|jgi:transforming growth factor-beta-induced protein